MVELGVQPVPAVSTGDPLHVGRAGQRAEEPHLARLPVDVMQDTSLPEHQEEPVVAVESHSPEGVRLRDPTVEEFSERELEQVDLVSAARSPVLPPVSGAKPHDQRVEVGGDRVILRHAVSRPQPDRVHAAKRTPELPGAAGSR
jgi:hypothetical protein